MSVDESFSSSDESHSSSVLTRTNISKHLTCNHRLANQDDNEAPEETDDLFPLINESGPFKLFHSTKKEEYWLVFKAYFAITFLMIALLSLFFLFFNHLVLSNTQNEQALNSRFNSSLEQTTSTSTFQINLDPHDRYHLFWSIDYDSETVLFELRLKLATSFDWFAFGFSEYGSISNADLCMIWFDKKRILHLKDAKTDNESLVLLDHNSNDCQFIKAKRSRTEKTERFFYLAFRRYFDTCDPEDYLIDNGTTHLVYGTGRGPVSNIEGIQLTKHVHGFQRVQLLKSPQRQTPMINQLSTEQIQTLEFLVDNVTVPNIETTYWCRLSRLPDTFKRKIHIVQYEAVVEEGSRELVHHMELFHCEVDASLTLPEWNGLCHDDAMPELLHKCKRVVAAWAYGAGVGHHYPMIYPSKVGFPIGGSNYSLYLMIEIHYNNPELKSGSIDNSGIRIHFTDHLRPLEAGILEVGLEYSDKNSIPPNVVMELRGYCVSECTRVGLPSDGITIFASQLHTHLTGISTWTEHVRGGVHLSDINRDNHYSPHFQEIRTLFQPVRIYPGDALVHVCRYDTRKRNQITLGGFAITEEMCVNYLHYYPKSELEVCKSSIDTGHLWQYFDSMRIFENQNTSSNYTFAENYRNIHWTPYRTKKLDQLYQSSPLSVQCNQSSGLRFPGYWNGIPLTVIRESRRSNATLHSKSRCRWVLKKILSAAEDELELESYLDMISMPKGNIRAIQELSERDNDEHWQQNNRALDPYYQTETMRSFFQHHPGYDVHIEQNKNRPSTFDEEEPNELDVT